MENRSIFVFAMFFLLAFVFYSCKDQVTVQRSSNGNPLKNSDTPSMNSELYPPNLLTNGNFTSFNNGVATGWSIIADGSTDYTASEGTGSTGSAQKIEITDSPGWGLVFYQDPDFDDESSYEWRITYKTSGSNSIKAEVASLNFSEVVVNETLPGTNGSWSEEVISFTHDNPNADLLRIATSNTGSFWLDAMALTLEVEEDIDASWDSLMVIGERTVQDIEDWYEQYTGFDGDAYVIDGYADDLGRNLTLNDLTSSNSITTTQNGQVIERMDISGNIRVEHDNVVVRGNRIVSTSSSQNGIDVVSGAENVTIEYNTLIGPGSGTNADRAIWVSASGATARFNQLDGGHSSGFQLQGPDSDGSFFEYNYVPGVRTYQGSHNTSTTFCATRGDQSVYQRNFIRDGTSAVMSLYPQSWCGGPIDNLYIAENIIESCCRTLWYYINSGGGSTHDDITNVEFFYNVFIPGLNPQDEQMRPLGDETGPFTDFEENEGNVWDNSNQLLNGTQLDL